MYCQNCGEQISDTAKFCKCCGRKVITEELEIIKSEPQKEKGSKSEAASENIAFKKMKMYGCLLVCILLLLTPFMSVFHMTYAEVVKTSGTNGSGYDYAEDVYFSPKERLKEHNLSMLDMFNQMRYRMGEYSDYCMKERSKHNEDKEYYYQYEDFDKIETKEASEYWYIIDTICVISGLIIFLSIINIYRMLTNLKCEKSHMIIFYNNSGMVGIKTIIGNVFYVLGIKIALNLNIEQKKVYGDKIYNTFENFGISFWFILIIVAGVLVKVFASKEEASTYEPIKALPKEKKDDSWVCTCGHRNSNSKTRCEICYKNMEDVL